MRTRTLVLLLAAACGKPATPNAAVEPAAEVPVAGTFAGDLVLAMDPTVDPCNDFYAYACGGWIAKTELPADKPVYGRGFSSIDDHNQDLLRGVLTAAAADPGDDPIRQKLGAFWTACNDTAAIDALGVEPLKPWLARVDALKDRKGLMKLLGELQFDGGQPLFGQWVDADAKDPSLAILQLVQGGLGLPDRDYYLEEEHAETRAAYETHIATMLTLSGTPEADAAVQATRVLAFETALAELHWPITDVRDADKTYNRLDLAGLKKAAPSLDWDTFFAAQGRTDLQQINVMTPSFFSGLDALLAKTDPADLRVYLRWHLISGGAAELAAPLDQESFRFYGQTLFGQQEQPERWKRCVDKADAAIGDLLAQAWVEQAFGGDSKPVALDMIRRIEKAFEEGLPALEWMDDETRARAVDKARAITNKIGYPDRWRTYPFDVKPDDHFGNVQRASAHEAAYWLAKAGEPVDRSEWFMTAPTVNAYYNPPQNEIVFPAGILQPPFFSADYPKAANFGAMGMVMGHEITHGFDDEGRKFDGGGKLTDWWSADAVARFEERAACVQEQYSGYEVAPGSKVDGELTLGENIADLGGTRTALRAYRQWVAESGPEAPVAGFDGDRLFFLSMAQAWCSISSPEYERVRVRTDPHAPSRFRVNGPLVNLPEFAETFQCAEGTAMNPATSCEVW